MEQKIALTLLGLVAVVATFALVTFQLTANAAVTASERLAPGAEPWTIQGDNCAWKSTCVVPEQACGGYLAYHDGYAAGCLASKGNLPNCMLTSMRMGSHKCSTADPIYSTRCVCP